MVTVVRVQFQVRQRATETDQSVQQPGAAQRRQILPGFGRAQGRVHVGLSGYVRQTHFITLCNRRARSEKTTWLLRLRRSCGERDAKKILIFSFSSSPWWYLRVRDILHQPDKNRLIIPLAVCPRLRSRLRGRHRRHCRRPVTRTVRRRWFIGDEFRKFINREVKQNLNPLPALYPPPRDGVLPWADRRSSQPWRVLTTMPPLIVGKLVIRANEFSKELDWVFITSLSRPGLYSRIIITTDFLYT